MSAATQRPDVTAGEAMASLPPERMPRWLLKYFCMAWIASFTVIFFPWVFFLMAIRRSRSGAMAWIQGFWAKSMLWAPGAVLSVEGKEHCDPKRPTIFVSNHQSTLDVPVLLHGLWPVELRFVIKKIIKYVPLFGWYLTAAGFVFIDRGNKKAALRSLQAAAAKIAAGKSIVMFPEGTRSDTGEILPFKKGPFALAIMAGVPITPVTVEGTRLVQPKNSWSVQPGGVRLKIGEPIDPKPFGNDREALARAVRDRIIDLNVAAGGLGGDKANAIARDGVPKGPRSTEEEAEA
jgi:1-acyl-sn-glycerol-3-phosphate acyltransferase